MKLTESATKKRQQIIDRIPDFPSIPTAALKVQQLLKSSNVDFNKLAKIIRNDQALTANLLRIANTVSFGGRRQIETVGQAIVRLGTRHVSQMVVGLAAASLMEKEVKGYEMPPKALWKHALAVAIGASELARSLDMEDPDVAFTGGMLHDIGKVALGNFVECNVDSIERLAFDKDVSFHVAERAVLGINHAELGSLLMKEWGLTERLVRVIQYHHDPDGCEDVNSLIDLVHVANAVAMQAGIGTGIDGLHYQLCNNSIERLGISEELMDEFPLEIEERVNNISDIFGE